MKLYTPWPPAVVELLNNMQGSSKCHPYTCPREHFTPGEMKLHATTDGWVCAARPACGYTQDWAHPFVPGGGE